MITTSEIAPSPALAPFIHCYAYREFNTAGAEIIKPWHASLQNYLVFFFKALPVKLVDTITNKILKTASKCDFIGMSTLYNGEMVFNGSYSFFQIIFKPDGFHKIFNISPFETTDKIVRSEDVFNSEIKLLQEQLYEAGNIAAMAELANKWLMHWLNKNKWIDYKDRITLTANLIVKNAGLVNVERLAEYACMSIRNFERIFMNKTGMSPKQLCCITRFNHALNLKLKYPLMNWTSIAYDSGYFDQMHLVKDFKRFCGEAPSSLLKHVPLFEEKYISRVNPV